MVFSPLLGFYLMLIIVLLMVISMSSPFTMWVCLELNMLMFLPIMSSEPGLALENTLKYFLIQSFASILFLIGFIMATVFSSVLFFTSFMGLMLKLGAAPFHGWFISILKSSSMWVLMLLSTLQKCAPLIMTLSFNASPQILGLFLVANLMVAYFSLSASVTVNKVLALSSMVNLGWFFVSVQCSLKAFFSYFSIYAFLLFGVVSLCSKYSPTTFSSLNNMGMGDGAVLIFTFMSLGGLPPLLGFLGKLLVLKTTLIHMSLSLTLLLVYTSLMVLNIYISRLFFMLANGPSMKTGLGSHKMSAEAGMFGVSLGGFTMLMMIAI
uniref:NADH-ubiquinone oxidoreductase chain 2 n=1 Tax=Calanus sinicus TaxID=114070 RepID=F1ADK6_CALSV|nr:NADH dehydrogenase subunit 2 [Calanus sinicus]